MPSFEFRNITSNFYYGYENLNRKALIVMRIRFQCATPVAFENFMGIFHFFEAVHFCYKHKMLSYSSRACILKSFTCYQKFLYPITPHSDGCTYIRNSTFFGVSRCFRIYISQVHAPSYSGVSACTNIRST